MYLPSIPSSWDKHLNVLYVNFPTTQARLTCPTPLHALPPGWAQELSLTICASHSLGPGSVQAWTLDPSQVNETQLWNFGWNYRERGAEFSARGCKPGAGGSHAVPPRKTTA